jgi:hypothetical protein
MIDPKINSRSKSAHSEQSESLINAAISFADSAVQTRAYQIYELRGRTDGNAQQDWYQAETDLRASRKQA